MNVDLANDTHLGIRQHLLDILACPDCKAKLLQASQSLTCTLCARSFPLADGLLPILLGKASDFLSREGDYAKWRSMYSNGASARSYRQKRYFPRTTPYDLRRQVVADLVASISEDQRILNVGAGRMRRPGVGEWVHLDIHPNPNCDVVGDAHELPFADEVFNMAVSTNVFEALKNPFAAAAELQRVLKPGGIVFVDVAFCLPALSGDYYDCFRFSGEGLRAIFRTWEVLAVGPSTGPFVALARLVERMADRLFPSRLLSFVAAWTSAWMLHPLKYLDPWILRGDGGANVAASFYIVARKPGDVS